MIQKIMNSGPIYRLGLFIVLLIVIFALFFRFIQEVKVSRYEKLFEKESLHLRASLHEMIEAKENSTMAIALALGHRSDFTNHLDDVVWLDGFFSSLSKKLREETRFKNVWFQLIDAKGASLYRSWSPMRGDSLLSRRPELKLIFSHPHPLNVLSVGRFDLSFKSMVPLRGKNGYVPAILEVITHFNSIAEALKKEDVYSAVVVDKKHSAHLTHPFTGIFVRGDYIANKDIPKPILAWLEKEGAKTFFDAEPYKISNGHLVVAEPLHDIKGDLLGYYLMFKPLSSIPLASVDRSILQNVLIFFGVIMGVVLLIIGYGFWYARRQRVYLESIINSSADILITTNGKQLISANRRFFDYFHDVKSVDEFAQKYECICNFFIEEPGYLHKEMDGESWLEFLLRHMGGEYKAKVEIEGNIYYFSLKATPLKGYSEQYCISMVDITNEEILRKELENFALTDALTGAFNRRHFQQMLEKECSEAERYGYPLTLIMFDIDHFKSINDRFGHDVGDMVLKEMVHRVTTHLRKSDLLFRIGGEEFVVLMPHTELTEAQKLAKRLKDTISLHPFPNVGKVTVSMGVTKYCPGETIENLYRRLDQALYRAKKGGRDRIETARC